MSVRRKLFKAVIFHLKKLSSQLLSKIKKQIIWLLRTIFTTNRRRGTANAGFVLPTVAMVSLVVVLLTTAILFRSFERSKNASNVRVNEAALNAATPAIDRARAKLNKLFQDGRLPRATPTDDALYSTFSNNINEYTFGDETQLKLALSRTETDDTKFLKTAWQYPVDTDNNGKFDSYTLYGIYFKNPPIASGAYTRARNSLEARTPPMTAAGVNGDCGDTLGTSATLVGSTGWFNIGNKLKKAFFVYTANVPITTDPTDITHYEKYKGNKGFSALEYQQDRVQLSLVNNAVVYEDDIDLSPGPIFRLNGRIFTNSNFITGSPTNNIKLYQVSSRASCYYEAENAKIIVGGNLGAGGVTDTGDASKVTKVDLFRKGEATDPVEVDFAKSTTPGSNEANLIAYNSLAYVQRINRLVSAQIANITNPDPTEVTNGIQQEKTKLGLTTYTAAEEARLRRQHLELYFKKRTRRVPYKEVPSGSSELIALGIYATTSPLQGSNDTLRPIDAWIYPTDPTDGKTGTNYTKLALSISNGKLVPGATEPTKLQKTYEEKEQSLGDRVVVGNNLPQLWWDSSKNNFVGPNPQDTQNISGITWNDGDGTRTRRSRVEILADLGSTDRDKDWELAAAKVPTSVQDPVGGLRVITGAGIYLPKDYTTTGATGDSNFAIVAANPDGLNIWSDMMPVNPPASPTQIQPYSSYGSNPNITFTSPQRAVLTPYLRMRATAVYHYKADSYNALTPTPIACVSSYYDPTNKNTARNKATPINLADVSPISANDRTDSRTSAANSNNGIVYGPPNKSVSDYQNVLNYQAQLKYENGRWVNEPLKNALAKLATDRTIAEQSAINAEICALQILDGTVTVASTPPVPHGAIQETAFLDARQIKAIHKDNTITTTLETFRFDGDANPGTDYNLEKKYRQPLEIRATVLNLNLLRTTTIGGTTPAQEYLLPNSGIIYATRNDALPDLSSTAIDSEAKKLESPVDYKLDPTRRPNAIMLVNGEEIWRELNYRDVEKGLILATNLPVYVKGDFNKHTQEEFGTPSDTTGKLADNWSNFYTRTKEQRNPNFACRPNDLRLLNCTTGDKWRPASVLADAITLLSNNFRLGFRNEGDYDLNNNLGIVNASNPRPSGYEFNAYAPTATASYDSDGNPKDLDPNTSGFQGSSYFNNFVTPLVRQIPSGYYLTEVCTVAPSVTNPNPCSNPFNWTIKTACGAGGGNNVWDGNIIGKNGDPTSNSRLKTGYVGDTPDSCLNPIYGTRMALQRNTTTGQLIIPANVLAVDASNNVQAFPLGSKTSLAGTNLKTATPQTLIPWLQPSIVGGQEVFTPVLQLDTPFGISDTTNIAPGNNNNWLPVASETTFNLIAAAGDTPARPIEDNGGLHNFVRFLENWNPDTDPIKARISGSFIQVKRSAYATAPFSTSLSTQSDDYRYRITGNDNRTPFYLAPTRQWGYDVALLSQSPDLFAQKLVSIPDDLPDEYFREVGRDDTWVATLLCAKKTDASSNYAIGANQRPASCQS